MIFLLFCVSKHSLKIMSSGSNYPAFYGLLSRCSHWYMTQDSLPFCLFYLLSRYCTVFQATRSPCPSALFRLHSSLSPEAIKCTALFSICFHRLLRYYGCVGLPSIHLDSWRISLFWFPYLFQKEWQDLSCSDNILLISLAKLSDWGTPPYPRPTGHDSVVCFVTKYIDHFQPHNIFPAQSLHFRFGSAAPCPTLKPNVTASPPRTQYRRLARPYLIGFSYCIVIMLTKACRVSSARQGKSASLISQLALVISLSHRFLFLYFFL